YQSDFLKMKSNLRELKKAIDGLEIDLFNTVKCPHCHEDIFSDYKFCPYCGKKTEIEHVGVVQNEAI
ncbi:zinc ribbon domain-containing protein, partial [Candidatus Bathyarchaeota archaeon]|nr:zinc ribbon domain-containing protein [Candidatus Bathyarchaeota archaeon]